ncbi:LysM peptidoglycan-binding domain-containing protein [Luteipulveratus mongoliensis]|uniref:LysM peptidoglycan-binding domain-containing protein n=1 Tax=Luteipulveratus mongoliensis TaxID=571913 RepID=UPI00069714FC|nr:LysM peptidoglycan-binding domain-containing protein [Luteipulveratus mongoliensis]
MGLLDDIKENLGLGDEAEKARKAQDEAKTKAQADEKAAEVEQARQESEAKKAPAPAPPVEQASHKTEPAAHKTEAHAAPAAKTYTVKKGDTLSEIGQHFGVSWKKIAELNNIENPDLIFPGQVFKIPG